MTGTRNASAAGGASRKFRTPIVVAVAVAGVLIGLGALVAGVATGFCSVGQQLTTAKTVPLGFLHLWPWPEPGPRRRERLR